MVVVHLFWGKIVKKILFGVWDLFEVFYGEVFYVCNGQILQKL